MKISTMFKLNAIGIFIIFLVIFLYGIYINNYDLSNHSLLLNVPSMIMYGGSVYADSNNM